MRWMVVAGLALAGCQQSPEQEGQRAAAREAKAAAAAMSFSPGQWETTSELVAMDVPGMPAELAKANLGQVNRFSTCMTPEMARKPDANFFTNNSGTTSCKTERFDMSGGRLQAAMVCTDKQVPGQMRLTIDGRYAADSYQATSTMERSDGPEGTNMKMTAKTSARRTGACATEGKVG